VQLPEGEAEMPALVLEVLEACHEASSGSAALKGAGRWHPLKYTGAARPSVPGPAITIDARPEASQEKPTRVFLLDPLSEYTVEQFYLARDVAYTEVVVAIKNRSLMPSAFDVRPTNPVTDFDLLTGASPVNNFFDDWSISSGIITNTSGDINQVNGTVNQVVGGTMPLQRFLCFWGISIETSPPFEVFWKFFNGANVKTIWFLQELFSFPNPRATSKQIPVWGQADPIGINIGAVQAVDVFDVFYSLWAEPTATSITSGSLQA
jgi:hypothetical protein